MKYWKGLILAALMGGLFVSVYPTDALGQVGPGQPIKGTIPVEEGANYEALAKITPEQARKAAQEELPGATFEESELEEEDGYLVYEVEMRQNGRDVDVLVDAGDGSVLRVDHHDNHNNQNHR